MSLNAAIGYGCMGIYIVLILSDGDEKKNASIMGNVLPPNNSVVHKPEVQ